MAVRARAAAGPRARAGDQLVRDRSTRPRSTRPPAGTALTVGVMGSYGLATSRDLIRWMRPLFWALLGVFALGDRADPRRRGRTSSSEPRDLRDRQRLPGHLLPEPPPPRDRARVVWIATGIFINIINIFLALLRIFGSSAERARASRRRGRAANLRGTPMSEHRYDPQEIEPRWQALWAQERTWEVSNDAAGATPAPGERAPKAYVLEMLPYPSGEPHIGHLKGYSVGDAIAHFRRRTGHRVLHPMGYDAFGLPAENHAIKTGVHPRDSTAASIASFQRAVPLVGDLDRLVARARHARAALLPLDAVDLPAAVQRRPGLPQGGGGQVVPARPDGARQRAGDRRALRALRRRGRGPPARAVVLAHHRLRRAAAGRPRRDRLARARQDDAAQLDRALGGRRGGVPLRGARAIDYPVFTTRPDTLFGATFFVMAPEHPDVLRLAAGTEHEQRGARVHQPRAERVQRGARRRREGRRPACRSGAR